MPKPVITFVFKCYATDCFGTYFTHVQTCNVTRVQSGIRNRRLVSYFAHAQTCNVTRVRSATQSTASVHTLRMPKPVITFVFKCYAIDCFGTYFTHAQTCDNVCVQMLRNQLPR